MKIVLLTPWYPDERQPFLGLFIREQAQALANTHEVVVIVAKVDYSRFALSKYTLTEKRDSENLIEYQLTIFRSLPVFNQLHHLFITWKISRQLLAKQRVDVVHSFIGYPGAFWGWLMSRTLKAPFVHTEHTKLSNNYRSFWHKTLTNFGMRRASLITTVSHWLANQIEKVTLRSPVIIPNMMDVTRFVPKHMNKSTITQIGFVGGLNTNVKGLDLLLHALSKYKYEFMLHIAGDGLLKEEYERLATQLGIKERCTFYGSVQADHMPSFYQALHFFVCASRHETFSIAIVEALASGIPVVSTKCGGPEEILQDNSLGVLVERENNEALLKGILWMIENYRGFDPKVLHAKVDQKYSIQSVLPLYEQVYEQCHVGSRNTLGR